MTAEQEAKLWLCLGSIEEHCANTSRYIEKAEERADALDKRVDDIELERATEKGEAKAAGRNAGLLGGGIISVVIAGLKAAVTGS